MSILPDKMQIVLTATQETISNLIKNLTFIDPVVIKLCPNRSNIYMEILARPPNNNTFVKCYMKVLRQCGDCIHDFVMKIVLIDVTMLYFIKIVFSYYFKINILSTISFRFNLFEN